MNLGGGLFMLQQDLGQIQTQTQQFGWQQRKRLKKIVIQQLLFGVIGKLQDVRVLMEKQEMVEISCAIVHYQKGINQQEQI